MAGAAGLSFVAAGSPVFASTPSTAALERIHPAMRQVLHYGSRGHWVMTLQADLALLGYPQVGPTDGVFGPKTEAGLKAFQTRNGFTATGVTSPVVWQDILAGFGLVPAYGGPGSGQVSGTNSGSSPGSNPGSSGGRSNTGLSTSIGSGNTGGHVLPAAFPIGGTPVSEPSLPNSSAGIRGQFTPKVSTIDGRPVLKAFHMVATSYGPSLADNYPYGPVDAFGQPLENGMVAVDPRVIPLGTVVYVTGYQDNFLPRSGFLGKAMDTGGAINGNRMDIFINASPQVIGDFGMQQVTVYVLGH